MEQRDLNVTANRLVVIREKRHNVGISEAGNVWKEREIIKKCLSRKLNLAAKTWHARSNSLLRMT